jgi:hypothetical protein
MGLMEVSCDDYTLGGLAMSAHASESVIQFAPASLELFRRGRRNIGPNVLCNSRGDEIEPFLDAIAVHRAGRAERALSRGF